MAMNPGDSVKMNLSALFEIEAERREQQAAAEERERAEAAARTERERAERERSLRAAEQLTRTRERLAAEAARRAAERRIHDLRADLAAVRADRHQTQLQVAALVNKPPARDPGRSWMAGTLAAVSLVAALTATLVAWPRSRPVAAPLIETPATVHAEVHPAPAAIETVVEPLAETAEATEADVAEPAPAPVHHRRPPRGGRPRPPADDLSAQLDFGPGDGLIPD